MSIEELIDDFLTPYSEEEQFYKNYHLARQSPETFQQFLSQIDASISSRFYIPEINSNVHKLFEETHIFSSLKNNILIEKHQRYTPPFRHAHDFFEMIYVWRGTGENTVEDNLVQMRNGDICILSPAIFHTLGVFDDSILINILIKKSTFNETFFPLLSNDNLLSVFFTKVLYTKQADNYVIFHTEGDLIVRELLSYLIRESLLTIHDSYSDLLRENLLTTVFGYLLRGHARDAELSGKRHTQTAHMANVLQFLQDHYKTATLETTARHFGYTASYLSRQIKAATGSSFSKFLGELRFKKACMLLSGSMLPIQEISEMAGFGSTEHFYRTFKRMSGETPASYRMRHHQ
jgi:araC-type DNA-binding domain-containing proteins